MTLISNLSVVRYGFKSQFAAVGATGDVTWSVLSGGAGGTIDSDGFYTAPSFPALSDVPVTTDTVQGEDEDGNIATKVVNLLGPLELFCEVIRHELGLSSDQVFIYNQKWTIPNDSRLYVPVEVLTCKPFGNSNKPTVIGGELKQVQSTNFASILSIDALSRSTQALYRKEEIIMALNSQYAQQLMSTYSFWIAPLTSSFAAINQEDGAAIPYQFNMSCTIQYAVSKVQESENYTSFSGDLYMDPEAPDEPIPFGPQGEE